jgi:transcriptional regulator with XRE-family HTH domain
MTEPRGRREQDLREDVAKALRDALEETGWTQTQLADIAGITRQRLSQILSGEHKLTIDTISLVAAALGACVIFTTTVGQIDLAAMTRAGDAPDT